LFDIRNTEEKINFFTVLVLRTKESKNFQQFKTTYIFTAMNDVTNLLEVYLSLKSLNNYSGSIKVLSVSFFCIKLLEARQQQGRTDSRGDQNEKKLSRKISPNF
jgi:hypothetical protein